MDFRLIDSKTDLNGNLEKAMKLHPLKFDVKSNGKHDVGIIAQEVVLVQPEAVLQTKSGHYVVDYEKLIPMLVGCIQELDTELKVLKKELSMLKKGVNKEKKVK